MEDILSDSRDDRAGDDELPSYFVSVFPTERGTTISIPHLDITLEGDWAWIDDAETAAKQAIAVKLGVDRSTFQIVSDCPIDMDPKVSLKFRAELEQRAADHGACAHDWQAVQPSEVEGSAFLRLFGARRGKASRCRRCKSIRFTPPNE